jgi:hypothetical protein
MKKNTLVIKQFFVSVAKLLYFVFTFIVIFVPIYISLYFIKFKK